MFYIAKSIGKMFSQAWYSDCCAVPTWWVAAISGMSNSLIFGKQDGLVTKVYDEICNIYKHLKWGTQVGQFGDRC